MKLNWTSRTQNRGFERTTSSRLYKLEKHEGEEEGEGGKFRGLRH